MFRLRSRSAMFVLAASLALAVFSTAILPINAADHGDSPLAAVDPGADIAGVFGFLDPNDNSRVVIALDVAGFVVPSESVNFGFFSADVLYRFEIENTGDAKTDQTIEVTFSLPTSTSEPQTATVKLPNGRTFSAPTTVQTHEPVANPFVITTDSTSGAAFFAGLTDDPFYFDIVGFNRFITSVLAGAPDPSRLQRNRDSFAGYNIHTIALSIPASMLRGPAGNTIGLNGVTLRQQTTKRRPGGEVISSGKWVQVDRMATPMVNTAFIQFPRKNEYNLSTPQDDAAGVFANDIVATLRSLGTNQQNINLLSGIAVTTGDYLRLDLSVANDSLGEGQNVTTPGYTGFPNGRRPGDDTINSLLFFITNQSNIREAVNSNDAPLSATFPFFAAPNQPLENPSVDNTKN